MPIFEYKCNECGHVTEFLQKSSGKENRVCEKCKGSNLQKLFSGFSVGHSSAPPKWQGCDSCSSGPCPTGTCPLS
jgi:putative FmdB family regulatory protein